VSDEFTDMFVVLTTGRCIGHELRGVKKQTQKNGHEVAEGLRKQKQSQAHANTGSRSRLK